MQPVIARKLRDKDIGHYVDMANVADAGAYITIFTKCGVITGKIISGKNDDESIKTTAPISSGTYGAITYHNIFRMLRKITRRRPIGLRMKAHHILSILCTSKMYR
jgi:hypothetical protein